MNVKGITDEITSCGCCGKSNLKKTVILEGDDGEILYYGSECAAAALTGKKSRKGGELVANLAGAVDFFKRNRGKLSVDQIRNRLAVCRWARIDDYRGEVWIVNDAGKVRVA